MADPAHGGPRPRPRSSWRRLPPVARRLPAPLRTALVAGLVALLLAGAAAWWFQRYAYDAVYRESVQRATELSLRLADRAATGWKDDPPGPSDGPFVQVDPTGRILTGAGGALDLADLPALLPPPPPGPPPGRTVGQPLDDTVRIGGTDERSGAPFHLPDGTLRPVTGGYPDAADHIAHTEAHYLAHRTLTVVATPVRAPAGHCTGFAAAVVTEPDGTCRSTLYVLVPPYVAAYVADTLTVPLAVGVPVAALLVAATAWAAARRTLRPVEAIRREVAVITAGSLDRRVPVPEGRDAIRALARTTNATLDRLEDAVERQARFTADAAHELRSPLAALRYHLETALDHPGAADPTDTLAEALTATRRLHALSDDLLLLARPEPPAPRSLVDLTGLAAELVLEYAHLGRQVTLADAPAQAAVRGDGPELHRLLRNLLDNAVRHARTAVTVTVTVTVPVTGSGSGAGPTAAVTVHNDGTTLTPEECETVFARFTRLDEARGRDAGGSGLGLAIARSLAHRHRGTLTARPADPPPGTVFELRLPVVTTADGTAPPA
ncbi:HAMP domain-containing sensor histidine kinase [Streptomyces sp. NPDC097619]|uniref:sensor histidine kinase n=1 Tax=Streptomyces sp. NPDC097619 TaxID=3157228 RepID=UPI0033179A4B